MLRRCKAYLKTAVILVAMVVMPSAVWADDAPKLPALTQPPPAEELKLLPPDDATVQAMALTDKADYYVKTHQWIKLSFLLQGVPDGFKSKDEFKSAIGWMSKTLFSGGPIVVAFPHAAAMWTIGEHQADPAQAQQFKDMAGMTILYAIAVSDVDGARCADASVKERMLARILRDWKPLLHYVATLPQDARQPIIERALAMELKTISQRSDDYSLCSQGLDSQPATGAAPTLEPKFKTATEAAPAQDVARGKLRIELLAILASFGMK